MNYKVITPVSVEPVSLAEAKSHLRLTSDTFSGDVTTAQSISPGLHTAAAAFGLDGAAVDVLGYITLVSLDVGACGTGGSIAAKVQHSDDATVWEDYSGGAFTTVTEANDNAIQELDYAGAKQYVRVVTTVAGASCSFSATVTTKTGDATEDTLIEALITAAREWCEGFTGRALATQTVELYLDSFPSKSEIELPKAPLQSVTSIKYKDSAGTETTMTADTDYIVDLESDVGRIVLPYGGAWPSFAAYPVNPIKVRYAAGYDTTNQIPKSIKQAMLLLIGHWYTNREAVGNVGGQIEFAVKALLSMYRVRWFG